MSETFDDVLTTTDKAEADKFIAEYGKDALPHYIWSRHYNETVRRDVGRAVEILKYLVSQGADVHSKEGVVGATVHCAAYCNPRIEVLKYLVSQGVDVNIEVGGYTPIFFAAQYALTTDVIEYLASQGADVNPHLKSGNMMPVDIATYFNHNVEIAECLIALGAEASDDALQLIEKRKQSS